MMMMAVQVTRLRLFVRESRRDRCDSTGMEVVCDRLASKIQNANNDKKKSRVTKHLQYFFDIHTPLPVRRTGFVQDNS